MKYLASFIAVLLTPSLAYCQTISCAPSLYYPIIEIGSNEDAAAANDILERVLIAEGYALDAGRYTKTAQECFIEALTGEGKLRVIPYVNGTEELTAQQFLDFLLPRLQSEISSRGLSGRLRASEEILLQD